MFNESKFKNLHQYLTTKNTSSSKKVTINIRSETTSPSSYNERNYSTQKKPFNNNIYKNNIIHNCVDYKKSNTIEKNCYNNINLLTNLKEHEDDIYDSLKKDLNKSNSSNTSKISVVSISNNKNSAIFNKSSFLQSIKYYTRKSKNNLIKNDEINFFLKPITKFINNHKKNTFNLKNIKKEMEEKNSSKIGKKEKEKNKKFNSITYNKEEHNNNINNNIGIINSNDNRNYIGIDDNFNLTFGKSSNKIEIYTSSNNNSNNYKNIKIKNTKKIKNNLIFNQNNYNYNINTIKNKKKSQK